jgi:hypothetical protein
MATPAGASAPIRRVPWRLVAAAVLVVGAIFSWKALAPSAARQDLVVKTLPERAIAFDEKGVEQWRYEYGPDIRSAISNVTPNSLVVGGVQPGVFIASTYLLRKPDEVPLTGVLRWFSLDGKLQKTFSFDDQWSFAGRQYAAPWAVTDFRTDDSYGRRHIAVAAHHYTWWPSIVTILDDRFQREGTFVNSGWVEYLRWIGPDRLAISGFNERLDGGMVAVLDTHDIEGASPEPPGTPFTCDNCRSSRPLFYAVFPRSELNRVTGSPFNRASVDILPDGVRAHTTEMEPEPGVGLTEAVYEFSSALELVSASYGSRYWDKHRALELAGKLNHSRETCPEKNGPPFIWTWTREAGWKKVPTSRSSHP